MGPALDQLQQEALHRWFRPPEVAHILTKHSNYNLNSQLPLRPPAGSWFLFDRKVLRYFRKDGYNWRKKKDGKTVNEAHEKLKCTSVEDSNKKNKHHQSQLGSHKSLAPESFELKW